MTAESRRHSNVFRVTAAILIAGYLPACTGWHTESATPEQVLTATHPERVRITRQGSPLSKGTASSVATQARGADRTRSSRGSASRWPTSARWRSGVGDSVVSVRLESAPSFWMIDHVAVTFEPEPALGVQDVPPAATRTAQGKDVRALVAAADDREWAFEQGERAELRFPVPRPSPGMARSYLVRAGGWYRIHVGEAGDADLASLRRIIREPGAVAKLSITTLNEALQLARSPR